MYFDHTVRFQLVSLNGRAKRNTKCIANIKRAGEAKSNNHIARENRKAAETSRIGNKLEANCTYFSLTWSLSL